MLNLEWRYWDVAIAIFGFLIQCGLAWLGLTLTHWKHKAAFFGLVTVGAVFTGVAVKRGVDSADRIQTQLNQIQKNTEVPPNVVVNTPPINIPPAPVAPSHTYVSYEQPVQPQPSPVPLTPFTKDEQVFLNGLYTNGGNFPILWSKQKAQILVVPTADVPQVFKKYSKQLANQVEHGSGALMPNAATGGIRDYFWTFQGPTLSETEANELNSGIKGLCMIGEVQWADATGTYVTSLEQCLGKNSPPGVGFNWHIGKYNNRERALTPDKKPS